jgi:predicted MPP superfamily phosphohydrolase
MSGPLTARITSGRECLHELALIDPLRHIPLDNFVMRLHNESRVALALAGHTHGGQIFVPFFGPPLTLSRIPRHMAAGGLHELNGVPLHVSRGIGMERGSAPQIRFLCPPEISLLTLRY